MKWLLLYSVLIALPKQYSNAASIQQYSRDVLLYQIPDTMTAMGYRCQRDTAFSLEADVAEDILVTGEGWQIDSITCWWVEWGGFSFSWDSVPNVHVIVYDDSNSQPCDSPIIEVVVEPANYTAYQYLDHNWRLDVIFPAPVVLDTGVCWIEVQPSMSTYPTNGNLGILGQNYIGNGHDFYFRFPETGVTVWQSATQTFGQPLEAGFILYGDIQGEFHDVSTEEICAPAENILAGCSLHPEIIFRNCGNTTDTCDVYVVIDSSGTTVYDETENIVLYALCDTLVQFPTWTVPENSGVVYVVTAYCILNGDENHDNDSLSATVTTFDALWKTYADLPKNTHNNALVYSVATGIHAVYSLGGRGAYADIFMFDCNAEAWDTTQTTLLIPVWMASGVAVGDKIYVMGGAEGMSWFEVEHNQEFDPVAQSVSLKAPLPTARYSHGAVVWRDTLIYVMGGSNFDFILDDIEIYSPATDSWISGDPLPVPNSTFACGISGDTIYVAGGRNETNWFISESWIGIIDTLEPACITWESIPHVPPGPSGQHGRAFVSGSVCDGRFYITGGYDHGYTPDDTWCFGPIDGAWFRCPDKPTGVASCGAAYVSALDGGTFFCAGGDLNNAGVYATEGLTDLAEGIEESPSAHVFAENRFLCMPSPLGKNTNITYSVTQPGHVVLNVYDGAGRYVETLVNTFQQAGVHTVYWRLEGLSSGVYFVRLEAGERTATHKAVVVK